MWCPVYTERRGGEEVTLTCAGAGRKGIWVRGGRGVARPHDQGLLYFTLYIYWCVENTKATGFEHDMAKMIGK